MNPSKFTLKKLFKLLFISTVAVSASAFTGCSSPDTWFKQADSPLPIEVQHRGHGKVLSFRAHETSDRLYVSGTAKNYDSSTITHLDIQLLGADGHVLAEKQDDLDGVPQPRISRNQSGRVSYVASFPLSEARQAVKIRVIYDSEKH